MSNDLKIKELNEKLDAKLEKSSWYDLLQPYIKGSAHNQFMNAILTDISNGIKFTPGFKDWFNEFFRVEFQKVKAVVITYDYTEVPFVMDDETFHLVLNRTDSESNIPNDHGSSWKIFNELVLEHISENKKHIAFIFVNPLTYSFTSALQYPSFKYFLPEMTSPFWSNEEHKEKTFGAINKVLETNGKSKIKW